MSSLERQISCLINSVENLPNRQAVRFEDMCAQVNGEFQYVQPVAVLLNGEHEKTVYYDKLGNVISDIVAVTDPCNCPCLDCPDVIGPPADTRCQLYGSFLSTTNSALTNPSAFDDPASNGPPGSPDFSCTNHFPIRLVVYAVSVGGTVVSSGPQVIATWNTTGDVPLDRGAADATAYVNSIPDVILNGTQFYPTAGGGMEVEYIAANPETRFIYGMILDTTPCRLDPFHREWTDEFSIFSNLGDDPFVPNAAASNSTWTTTQPQPNNYMSDAITQLTSASLSGGQDSCNPI